MMVGTLARGAADKAQKAYKTASRTESELRKNQLTWTDVGVLWLMYLVIVALPPARAAYFGAVYNWQSFSNSPAAKFFGIEGTAPTSAETLNIGKGEQKMREGEPIAGFTVTSDRGRRNIGSGLEMHQGVDLATPVGTALYAPAEVVVKCWSDNGGGGRVGEFQLADHTHKFLHLSTCIPGEYSAGEQFGQTGGQPGADGAGRSTGPHLDYRMKKGTRWVEPSRMVLTAALTGDSLSEPAEGFTQRYKAAIEKQESGSRYDAVNPHSGALGKYQFMPETAQTMADNCGLNYQSKSNFLASPSLQEATMDCYIEATGDTLNESDEYLRCRKLASAHYSGDWTLYNNRRPQTYNGHSYPSIADYTTSVCEDFQS